MGSNQSKLCSGDPERENRRAEQEMMQQMHMTPSDTAQATVHIHCNEDKVDQFLDETNGASIRFHFKVVKVSEMQPEKSLEGSETPSLSETFGAAEFASAALVEAKITEPGGEVAVQSEPSRDVVVRSGPNGDIVVGTDAQPTELDLPLACLCNKVVRALHVVEKSFRDSSERNTGHPAVKDVSPSSTEPRLSIESTSYQTLSPPIAAVEPQKAGDIDCPKEDAFLVSDQKAPREMDLELATGVAFGATEEPTTEKTQLEDASSEEAREEVAKEIPLDLSAGTSDELSGVSTDLSSEELAEILLSLWNGLPQAVSEPHLIMNKTEENVREGYCKVEDLETRQETLRMRAQHEMLAVLGSDEETEWPVTSRLLHNSKWAQPVICTAGEKVDHDGVLFGGDAVNLDSFKKDGSVLTAEGMKLHGGKISVVENMEAQPPIDIEETTVAPSSPKALLETAEVGQDGPMKDPQEACPDEPIVQGTGKPAHGLGAQPLPETAHVSGTVLQDGASGQKDTESAVTKQN